MRLDELYADKIKQSFGFEIDLSKQPYLLEDARQTIATAGGYQPGKKYTMTFEQIQGSFEMLQKAVKAEELHKAFGVDPTWFEDAYHAADIHNPLDLIAFWLFNNLLEFLIEELSKHPEHCY